MGNVLAGHKVAPGPDRPVHTVLLHVDSAGQQLGPFRQLPGGYLRLTLQNQVRIGFQLGILPGLRQPGVYKIL